MFKIEILVELVLEEGFYTFFDKLEIDMHELGSCGAEAKNLVKYSGRLRRQLEPGEDIFLVFRSSIASELIQQRSKDLVRTTTVVPNRISSINFWTENDSEQEFNLKCVGYTPWYPPEDAVQLFIGGPSYANDYEVCRTRRISSLKDFQNKFSKLF